MGIASRFGALVALSLSFGIGGSASCLAGDKDTPTQLAGVGVVDAEGVETLAREGARIVDTRALHDFLAGHLPGASHVDYKERSERSPSFDANEDQVSAFLLRLGKFAVKSRPVVFYCNGPSCWKSYKAAFAALGAGYRPVYWFRGGLGEWRQSGRPLVSE
jgi:rhodanese-related sulfurtransferase